MKNIIFVCTGNTCRSPIAEALLKHKLKIANIKNVKVCSAGIMVEPNTSTNEKSVWALAELGVKTRKKQAKQLTQKMVDKNTIIITMTNNHLEYVKNVATSYCIADFGSVGPVGDPYGQDKQVYLKTAKIIDILTTNIANKIIKGEL